MNENQGEPISAADAKRFQSGSTQVAVFAEWLRCSPVRPSRFLAMLEARRG
jgi:hypothetical protein